MSKRKRSCALFEILPELEPLVHEARSVQGLPPRIENPTAIRRAA